MRKVGKIKFNPLIIYKETRKTDNQRKNNNNNNKTILENVSRKTKLEKQSPLKISYKRENT